MLSWWGHHPCLARVGEWGLSLAAHQCGGGLLHPYPVGCPLLSRLLQYTGALASKTSVESFIHLASVAFLGVSRFPVHNMLSFITP